MTSDSTTSKVDDGSKESVSSINRRRSCCFKTKALEGMRRGNEAIFVQWRNSASSGIYNGMQVVYKIEVYKVEIERGISWGIVSMDFNICTEKISRYLEEKYIRGLRDRGIWIWISRELSVRTRREFGENNELAKIVELKQVE